MSYLSAEAWNFCFLWGLRDEVSPRVAGQLRLTKTTFLRIDDIYLGSHNKDKVNSLNLRIKALAVSTIKLVIGAPFFPLNPWIPYLYDWIFE